MSTAASTLQPATRPRQSRFAAFRSVFGANKLMLLGALLTAFFVITGVIGIAVLNVRDLNDLWSKQNLSQALLPPLTPGHVLGTDNFGRDLFWRIMAGTGVSLLIGVVITFFSMIIGMAMGTLAGFYGGQIDRLIGGLIDLTWGFPVILVAVIFAAALEPGFAALVLAVSVVNWAGFARIIRAQALSLRRREFVEAARALGISDARIMLRHIIPHTINTTLVMASYYVAVSVIVEAGLSFIGLGLQPPTPSLGQMVADGRNYLSVSAWAAVLPGLTITLMVLGLNTVGDGLRDFADPRLGR
jgi:peptide/nickel transport system permease protein